MQRLKYFIGNMEVQYLYFIDIARMHGTKLGIAEKYCLHLQYLYFVISISIF